MSDRDHYLENARAQFAAADVLCMRDEVEAVHFLGPTLLLLGFGIEAFLKAVLLDAGVQKNSLKSRPFGHDLFSMWTRQELAQQRDQATLLADQCQRELASEYALPQDKLPTESGFVPGLERHVPAAKQFEPHLRHLSDLHSDASNYALRYPEGFETVPEPMLLICVFDRLVRNYMNTTTIMKAPCPICPPPTA